MQSLKSLAIAAALVTSTLSFAGSAKAAQCRYAAKAPDGYIVLFAHGSAFKLKHACNRARRSCNRKLDRAFRKGHAPRGTRCYRGQTS